VASGNFDPSKGWRVGIKKKHRYYTGPHQEAAKKRTAANSSALEGAKKDSRKGTLPTGKFPNQLVARESDSRHKGVPELAVRGERKKGPVS